MIYDAWTYKQRPNNANLSTYTSHQQQCKSTPPFTLTNFDNNCIIKYLRPHNQQFIIQIRVLITLSTNIHINRHIYIYIYIYIYILIHVNYIIWLQNFLHFLTIQVKEKIQHFMINLIFNT